MAGERKPHAGRPPRADEVFPPPEDEQLSPERQAALLLFARERGATSVRRLALAAGLPVPLVEARICSALSTLLARGYSREFLCEKFSVTAEQLERASRAPALGDAFQPTFGFLWPAEANGEEQVEEIDDEQLIVELSELIRKA
jgi:hypothetical protein